MEEYYNLLDAFDKLDIEDKRAEITEELRELLAVFCLFMMEKDIVDTPLLHSDMNDYEEGTEHGFLNSTYAYLISIKENIGKYFYE